MNQKHYQLLALFTSSVKKNFTFDELASKLQIGERALRNYVTDINDFLASKGFHKIAIMPDKTLSLDSSSQELQLIQKECYSINIYQYHFSLEERITAIKLLLYKENLVTTTMIIHSLDISKKTCLTDMQYVLRDLEKEGTPWTSTNQGYSIDSSEFYRRDQLINHICSRPDAAGAIFFTGIDIWISKQFHLEVFQTKVFPLLMAWQKENNLNIEGYQFNQLVWILVVIVNRLNSGNSLIGFPCSCDARIVLMAESLYAHLNEILTCSPSSEEIQFLATFLEGLSLIQTNENHFGNIPTNIVIRSFLVGISNELNFQIANDSLLFDMLSIHIKSILSLLERKTAFEQTFFDELKEEYPDIYSAVKNNLYILEQSFHCEYDEKETAFLMMHIAAAVSRILTQNQFFQILIVCNTGVAAATYLTEKLKYHCKIDKIQAVPLFKIFDLLEQSKIQPDLIISLCPLPDLKIPVVYISQALNRQDLFLIQEKLSECRKTKMNGLNKHFMIDDNISSAIRSNVYSSHILSPERILLDVEADTWQEAIRLGANLLLEEGFINEGYIQAIINNVSANGPYFVFWPGIALAHADAGPFYIPFSASLIRLKQSITFGHEANDPVKYVLCFVASDTTENEDKILTTINLASNTSLFQHLDTRMTSEDACQMIEKFELQL